MGTFVDVDTLAGRVVVHGVIRRAVFEKDTLRIEGLTLPDAMAVLAALSTGTLAVAKLGGLLPTVPAVEAHQQAAPAPAPPVAAPPPAAPLVTPPSAAPEVLAPPPPVAAPVVAPVVATRVDTGPAPAPEADPFTAPEVAPAVETPAAEGEAIPTDVTRAQTLRPVVGWLGETKSIRDLAVMIAAVRELAPVCPLVAKIIATEDAKLNPRIEKTMITLQYLAP